MTDIELVDHMRDTFASLEFQCDKLRAFAQAVMKDCPDCDIDGGDLQELARKHGLMKCVKVAAPCNDVKCRCAETDNLPGICYRRTKLLIGREN